MIHKLAAQQEQVERSTSAGRAIMWESEREKEREREKQIFMRQSCTSSNFSDTE